MVAATVDSVVGTDAAIAVAVVAPTVLRCGGRREGSQLSVVENPSSPYHPGNLVIWWLRSSGNLVFSAS